MSNTIEPLVGLHLWLDDQRPAPSGWTHARSVTEAINIINACGNFVAADLDHWLGDDQETGLALLVWMHAATRWPESIEIHTTDPRAWERMRDFLRQHAPNLL